jgi:hypothetical protein
MTKKPNITGRKGLSEEPPRRVSLPGFISDEEIGLGDAIQRVTSYFGINHCGACQRRAAALNRRVVFVKRRQN